MAFDVTAEHVRRYLDRGDWVLLFNVFALVGAHAAAEAARVPGAFRFQVD